ncbi:hypothetical protein LMG24235_00487 [Paraburkholderia sabiae]|jgi:hypothetical protein|nr:hypothetical protein LMG24235_00487 [Paraburkholderia sabiae]
MCADGRHIDALALAAIVKQITGPNAATYAARVIRLRFCGQLSGLRSGFGGERLADFIGETL